MIHLIKFFAQRFKDAWQAFCGNPRVVERKVEVVKEVPYAVVRHQLGSIDAEDVELFDSLSKSERDDAISQLSLAWSHNAVPRFLNSLKHEQRNYLLENTKDMNDLHFARGTLNGIILVEENLQLAHQEQMQKQQDANEENSPIVDEI